MATVGTAATLAYDPSLRLYEVAGGTTTRFAYDSSNLIAEYDASNILQRRYVFGSGTDQPIVQYEGAGTTDRRWLHSDERGSIVAVTSSAGTAINTYDEYGKPGASNTGRFQYTGQVWLGELGLYYYKARFYAAHLGRFLQTDPIGTKGGINLYAYVANDPTNLADPTGLLVWCTGSIVMHTSCGMTPGWGCIGNCSNFQSPEESPSNTNNSDYLGFSLDPWLEACAKDAAACLSLTSSSSQSNVITGSFGFLNIEELLTRTWITFGSTTGVVQQHISSMAIFPNLNIETADFYEAWTQVDGFWKYGDTDTFGILNGSPGTVLSITAEAYYFPGARLNILSPLQVGNVSQAGRLPSCYCKSPPLGSGGWGPITVSATLTVQ